MADLVPGELTLHFCITCIHPARQTTQPQLQPDGLHRPKTFHNTTRTHTPTHPHTPTRIQARSRPRGGDGPRAPQLLPPRLSGGGAGRGQDRHEVRARDWFVGMEQGVGRGLGLGVVGL